MDVNVKQIKSLYLTAQKKSEMKLTEDIFTEELFARMMFFRTKLRVAFSCMVILP